MKANLFRENMKKEASHLLSRIKKEKNPSKKYLLFETLLEIYEELDIELPKNHSIWTEIPNELR